MLHMHIYNLASPKMSINGHTTKTRAVNLLDRYSSRAIIASPMGYSECSLSTKGTSFVAFDASIAYSNLDEVSLPAVPAETGFSDLTMSTFRIDASEVGTRNSTASLELCQ